MKAARIHDYRQPLVLEEVPTPMPGPGSEQNRPYAAGSGPSLLPHPRLNVLSASTIQVIAELRRTANAFSVSGEVYIWSSQSD
jgi:hypothetical protein